MTRGMRSLRPTFTAVALAALVALGPRPLQPRPRSPSAARLGHSSTIVSGAWRAKDARSRRRQEPRRVQARHQSRARPTPTRTASRTATRCTVAPTTRCDARHRRATAPKATGAERRSRASRHLALRRRRRSRSARVQGRRSSRSGSTTATTPRRRRRFWRRSDDASGRRPTTACVDADRADGDSSDEDGLRPTT